jgi:hypothetical protein
MMMSDILSMVRDLRRPRLLIRAARAGVADYKRSRDFGRVMRTANAPSPECALAMLLEEEHRIETTRQSGAASYSFIRHVELLIALMAEARLLPRAAEQ